jgi:hypothetical protein
VLVDAKKKHINKLRNMKITITIKEIKIELSDITDKAIVHNAELIKELISSVVNDYNKLEL